MKKKIVFKKIETLYDAIGDRNILIIPKEYNNLKENEIFSQSIIAENIYEAIKIISGRVMLASKEDIRIIASSLDTIQDYKDKIFNEKKIINDRNDISEDDRRKFIMEIDSMSWLMSNSNAVKNFIIILYDSKNKTYRAINEYYTLSNLFNFYVSVHCKKTKQTTE